MTMPSFAERTKISSILRGLMQGDGVHQEDKSVPVTSSVVTGKPLGRSVPILLDADERALRFIEESGAFTLEKSVGMYGDVIRLREKCSPEPRSDCSSDPQPTHSSASDLWRFLFAGALRRRGSGDGQASVERASRRASKPREEQ